MYLAQSVEHILSQDYPGELELVLALGPSRDNTTEIARRIAAEDPRVTVVDNPSGKISSAINTAVKAARHAVIARVDGHALIPPGYLRLAVATLSRTGAVNVGGVMAAEGETPFQRAVAYAMTSPYGVGASRFHTGGRAGPADTVYLGVFRRTAIEQVGGYDEEYLRAEDWEMNHRIRQSGGMIWFEPELRVTYRPRATAVRLGGQYFQYGRWRRVIARQHAGTINLRYLAPPAAAAAVGAGTLAGVAGLAARAAGVGGPWPLAATAGLAAPLVYGGFVLAVSARAARCLPPRAAARLPLALATMHMAWGAGFLTSSRRLVPAHSPASPPATGRTQSPARSRAQSPTSGFPAQQPASPASRSASEVPARPAASPASRDASEVPARPAASPVPRDASEVPARPASPAARGGGEAPAQSAGGPTSRGEVPTQSPARPAIRRRSPIKGR